MLRLQPQPQFSAHHRIQQDLLLIANSPVGRVSLPSCLSQVIKKKTTVTPSLCVRRHLRRPALKAVVPMTICGSSLGFSAASCRTLLAPWRPGSTTLTRAPSSCHGCGPSTETRLCCTTCWSSPRTVSVCVCGCVCGSVCVSQHSLWSLSGKQLLTCCLPHSHLLEADIWRIVSLHKCTSRFLINKPLPSSLPHCRTLSTSSSSSSSTVPPSLTLPQML